ncbi:MAG: class I SAM-dependent methyltransferase [Lactobacillus sp.]|jgi:16S rRNA (guanine1207-N2)-methyltransferase|nr:class I SAM-dependent methyltransferase [Lactobacillus sp.]MCH3905943.1 class I SAM-dependent methyltransferase [Lactobacillus sp.]MCH3990483.1 class I SAM-dependent methyltransferase [Lactobacillus sp.]MCH4068802.1 class I SAM-dependent methyltransferase [Lactobacillus sp.]MCI1304427.1 class I SAM-dependent methyltransferase [Lactobacillus sp.]
MTNQMYYAKQPTAAHDRQQVNFAWAGVNLNLTTDAGVFSKHRVDYGSIVLIKQASLLTNLPAGNVLDLGCGYGPIGLFAAKHWPERKVDLTDVNERALALAKHNQTANGIKNAHVFASNIYEQIGDTYALILTNPPIRAGKEVVSKILADAKQHLLPGGQILCVIQKKQGEPSAKRLLTQTFGNCQILKRDKGYYVLQSRVQA